MKPHAILSALLTAGAVAAPKPPSSRPPTLEAKARVSGRQGDTVKEILSAAVSLLPVQLTIKTIEGVIQVAEEYIALFLGLSTIENDVVQGRCADLTIIYARGTGETGNVGAVVGPPFFLAVADSMGGRENIALQGVDYAATAQGFLDGGDKAGSKTM